jgi:hypothetical protein
MSRPIAEHRYDPFSPPSDPFHSYFQSSYRFALLALRSEGQRPLGLALTNVKYG